MKLPHTINNHVTLLFSLSINAIHSAISISDAAIVINNNNAGRGRVRYEVALRLGNATIATTSDNNGDGKKKLNPHFAALLEKYVS
jgi:hypothetical protein